MKGIKFKEATIELKPSSMTDEECSSFTFIKVMMVPVSQRKVFSIGDR
jgi:hypothetical protein